MKLIILFLLLLTIITFYKITNNQLKEIYINAENIRKELESNIQSSINSVKFLNTAAQQTILKIEDTKLKYANSVIEYNDKGNYTADNVFSKNTAYNDKANISGYGGLKTDNETLNEMEMSLHLIPYFKIIKQEVKDLAWVYYYSNNNFITLYPFVESKDFALLPKYKKKPLFQFATPELNPTRDLFFTPLYVDNGGLGLMITIGMPLYHYEKFLGATELDITVKKQSSILKRLDYLNYHSVIVNKEDEIIGMNNIDTVNDIDTNKIVKISNYLSEDIITIEEMGNELLWIGNNYIYSKKLKNAPWKLVYYVNILEIFLISFFYIIPFIILMIMLYYISKLYQRTYLLGKELKEQSIRDYMTGSYNRRYFYEIGYSIFLKNKRKDTSIAVVMLDIDNFKNVNDTYGHDIGDIAIKEIPLILNESLRESDLVARFGGEEFCILIEDISEEDTKILFERIRKSFEDNIIRNEDINITYTVSFGIAYGMTNSLENMVKLADNALYHSKNNGRNLCTFKQTD